MQAYEQVIATLRARRSIRRFRSEPVQRDDLLRLFEAAAWAPSNHNRQPWKFIVLDDPEAIRSLAAAVRRGLTQKLQNIPSVAAAHADDFIHHAVVFENAPVVIAALHKLPTSVASALLTDTPGAELISGEILSVAMAVQNLALSAPSLGLGTCVLTGPLVAGECVGSALSLPPGCALTCLIALGKPAEDPPAPRRKASEHFVEFRNANP